MVVSNCLILYKFPKLNIWLENSFKDIILTDCDTKKVELLIYEVNFLIQKKQNHKS